jgi:hypothetical protein
MIKELITKIETNNFDFSEEFLIRIRIGEHLLWKKEKNEINKNITELFFNDFYNELLIELNCKIEPPKFEILFIDKYIECEDRKDFYIGGYFKQPNLIKMYVENNKFGHASSWTALHEFCHYVDYLYRGFTNHDESFLKLDYYGLKKKGLKMPITPEHEWEYPIFP